jgi:integrase
VNSAAEQSEIVPNLAPACSLPEFPLANKPRTPSLMNVHEAAQFLGVSESWVRRHALELYPVRVGRLVRFDATLMLRRFSGKQSGSGKPLKQGNERISMLRRYQNGYVYKTGSKLKVWYGMYREDVRKQDGTVARRQRNVRLGTLAELPTKFAAHEELRRRMQIVKAPSVQMTLTELVDKWIESVAPTLKLTTAGVYQKALKARIVPTLGEMPVMQLGKHEIGIFLAEKGRMYSRNTLREIRSSLSRVCAYAVDCGWLEKNPCLGVKLPLGTGKTITRTVLKAEQVTALANRLPEPYSTLVIFLAVTGLRIGEAVGLKWSDFTGDVLHVQRRIYEGKEDSTKTKGSDRKLPIPSLLLERMKDLGGTAWVFRSRNNTPLNPGNILKRYVQPACRDLGITLGGWHDLRHRLTTKLLRSGVAPTATAKILGQSNTRMLEIYDHPETDDFRTPLNEMADELLRNVTK